MLTSIRETSKSGEEESESRLRKQQMMVGGDTEAGCGEDKELRVGRKEKKAGVTQLLLSRVLLENYLK